MKILVANLGSTSFKYRLYDMADERLLARGGVERRRYGQQHLLLGEREGGERGVPGGREVGQVSRRGRHR